eukprot:TRINITY_DN2742_c0_g1_i2.p1 TRINITY_DN2742_c0_g1~~TRINITY_DN2742_c0_g1_i2.p1  ORF type:complete len:526 (+),score=129.57 TRINITY_DN2742_c0_g1_i2:54-1631(+)
MRVHIVLDIVPVCGLALVIVIALRLMRFALQRKDPLQISNAKSQPTVATKDASHIVHSERIDHTDHANSKQTQQKSSLTLTQGRASQKQKSGAAQKTLPSSSAVQKTIVPVASPTTPSSCPVPRRTQSAEAKDSHNTGHSHNHNHGHNALSGETAHFSGNEWTNKGGLKGRILSVDSQLDVSAAKASFMIKKKSPFLQKEEELHPIRDSEIHYSHCSSRVRLVWQEKPKSVLIVKKWKEIEITKRLDQMATWLREEHNIRVFVEPSTKEELPHLESYDSYHPDVPLEKKIDFLICLGGDGTILHAATLLKKSVPPVMAFHLGSMGFLACFDFTHFKTDIQRVLDGGFTMQLRSRLLCKIYRAGASVPCIETQVLNEVVVDRGDIPNLMKLDCYCDNRKITMLQADGIIIATATGSTAYSLSAGGSVVHPLVPGILFTPICPHALSARPLVFPDSALLEIRVPKGLRGQPKVCFDGRGKIELYEEDKLHICVSGWPVPHINKTDDTTDWIRSLARCLHWNHRIEQK